MTLVPPKTDGQSMNDVRQPFDEGAARIEQLARYGGEHLADLNEATTRLHMIDALVFDCLGWEKKDVIAEEYQQRADRAEYTDYTFYAPRRIMILEAKREGEWFTLPDSKVAITYEISSIKRGNNPLTKALEQVAQYCQSRGVPIAVICNGHQLLGFVANRTDGTPPLDGRAVIFPSLWHMREHFTDLWNCFSKEGIENKVLYRRLIGKSEPTIPSPLSASTSSYPGNKGRNVLQAELKSVADMVIEDMPESSTLEEEFLRNCYCASGALSQYSLASKAILRARHEALFDTEGVERPSTVAIAEKGKVTSELYAESMSRRPILLLGTVGVGKSTFIRHFMRIDAAELLKDAISLRIDLGTQAALASDLKSYIVAEITRQLLALHGVDIEAAPFVRGVYHSDLARFRKSIYGDLAESNPEKFREKELSKLESLIEDSSTHCMRSLEHLSKARRKQIVIFIDNADQRGDATQDEAFLVAQEIAAQWPALVYIPLRPETFYRSVTRGALSGYHPKAFTVSPPRIDRVLDKRLRYGLRLADMILEEANAPSGKEEVKKLKIVISSFLNSLERNEQLIECIDNIAAGNVRVALQLVRDFFGSGHVDTAKIIEKGAGYTVSLHEYLRAVIYGDFVHYSPLLSVIANVFDVSRNDGREHFLMPLMLAVLRQVGSDHKGFFQTDEMYKSLQGLGFQADQIDFAIIRALRKRLVETPVDQGVEDGELAVRKLRITPIGLYHLDRLMGLFTYVDAMIVATPIIDESTRSRILDVRTIQQRLDRAAVFKQYLDLEWEQANLSGLPFNWTTVSAEGL
jgi:hypothetical protein